VQPIDHASRATRHFKRLRFEHSPPDIGHAPWECSFPAFRYRFEPSRPGPAWVLPSFAGRRSWGSPAPFAGLLPHQVDDHLGSSGPTCLFVATARPDWFSSGASIRSIEIEAACGWIGFWAFVPNLMFRSGTPVCGPFPEAIVRFAARSFLPWALPLAGSADTLKCIRTGSTPPGSSNPKGRNASAFS
jgi:hypothetical protein